MAGAARGCQGVAAYNFTGGFQYAVDAVYGDPVVSATVAHRFYSRNLQAYVLDGACCKPGAANVPGELHAMAGLGRCGYLRAAQAAWRISSRSAQPARQPDVLHQR